jgi:hypothetical protein
MKTTLLVLFVLLATVGCEKHQDVPVSQQAIPPASVPSPVSVLPPASPPVIAPSPEPISGLDQVSENLDVTRSANQDNMQIYKCKTEQGVTFSDSPCGGQQEQLFIKQTSVIDNAALREKAKLWEQQDAIADADQAASLREREKRESLANRCFDASGNEVTCGNTSGENSQSPEPWYGDPYYSPYDCRYPNNPHCGRYRDIPLASKDGRYDARDRIINRGIQDPARGVGRQLRAGEQ